MTTSKDIRDYLQLYLGCNVGNTTSKRAQLVGFVYKDGERWPLIQEYDLNGKPYHSAFSWPWHQVKPILRPLSDMTEEEKQEAFFVRGDGDGLANNIPEAHEYKYLLSKGFDIFGLIESGLAIDKTKLKDG